MSFVVNHLVTLFVTVCYTVILYIRTVCYTYTAVFGCIFVSNLTKLSKHAGI